MAFQGKILKKLILTDPGHTTHVRINNITFIKRRMLAFSSERLIPSVALRGTNLAVFLFIILLLVTSTH
jgi:hypothetical protein